MPEWVGPNGERDLIPVTLFPNQGRGMGFSRTRGGFGEASLPEGYDYTLNMTVREGRLFGPSFGLTPTNMAGETHFTKGFVIPWDDGSGVPTVLVSGFATPYLFKNAAIAAETDATTAEYSSACFGDDAAGTALLYAGTKTGNKRLQKRTQAGTWSEHASQAAIFVANSGKHLWATVSTYQIANCPMGTNPWTGTWSASIQVCPASVKITSLGLIGDSPVCGAEDGVYLSQDGESFERVYTVSFNASHFPFMAPDGMGGLYTATAGGEMLHIQRFGALITVSPLRDKWPSRDTPKGPIKDVAVYGPSIYALMDQGYRLSQAGGLSMKVYKTTDNFGTFTDYSTNATDRSMATTADISSLDTLANGDALLIGADYQFLAVWLAMVATNGNAATLSIAHSNGAGGWVSCGFTVVDGWDGTWDASGNSFGQSGLITLDMGDYSTAWQKDTYNSQSKYWLRLTVSALLDVSVTIGEISLVPRRTGPAFTRNASAGADDFNASGLLPKLLRGRRVGDTVVWDDVITLYQASPAVGLAISPLPLDTSPRATLIIVTGHTVYQMPLPYIDEPSIADFPSLARDADFGTWAMIMGTHVPSAVEFDDYYELAYLECFGADVKQETDGWQAAFRWDDTNAWSVSSQILNEYALISFDRGSNVGRVLHTQFTLKDGAATEPVGPTAYKLRAWVRKVDRQATSQPARTTPEVS